ncbi:hypothetical protein RRG08_030191 [Elysia crispata]|uniref:Uncharacterized protein n=1 Tax=Elysia crispata TaxID=231223 RepID=A0AAE0ZRB3_9GAST|nr:hypothetical protein RRG08_030191 [Elysia crispata]
MVTAKKKHSNKSLLLPSGAQYSTNLRLFIYDTVGCKNHACAIAEAVNCDVFWLPRWRRLFSLTQAGVCCKMKQN